MAQQQIKLSDPTRERLAKLIGMLSSANDGEVLNAARLIVSTLKGAGADINDLAHMVKGADGRATEYVQIRPKPGPLNIYRNMAERCLRVGAHDQRTKDFLEKMVILTKHGRTPSQAQGDWLCDIYARMF